MSCFVCGSLSVALCLNCGVALCKEHLAERKQHQVGGTTLGCPHTVASTRAKSKVSSHPS